MAYKMKLNSPYQGMTYIWNISAPVGVLGELPNMPDDVELVQRLIIERYKRIPPKTPRAGGIPFIQHATGQMDLQTAFEVYWAGDHSKALKVAETISPARGGSISYGTGFWTIAWLNSKLFTHARAVWEGLPNLCSPILKSALLSKTAP